MNCDFLLPTKTIKSSLKIVSQRNGSVILEARPPSCNAEDRLPLVSHLVHFPPLWVQVAVHVPRGEDLGSYAQDGVRVRLPVNQAFDDCVLGGQVLSLQQVDAHDALATGKGTRERSDGKEATLKQICVNVGSCHAEAARYRDSYPWERGAELLNVQVGHQGNSEAVGENQVRGYCIHYHSVRHGTANECKDDVAQGMDTQTNKLLIVSTCGENETSGIWTD